MELNWLANQFLLGQSKILTYYKERRPKYHHSTFPAESCCHIEARYENAQNHSDMFPMSRDLL